MIRGVARPVAISQKAHNDERTTQGDLQLHVLKVRSVLSAGIFLFVFLFYLFHDNNASPLITVRINEGIAGPVIFLIVFKGNGGF